MEKLEKRVKNELDPVDVDELYDQMLDECASVDNCPTCAHYGGARILKEMDPVAYRCGRADYEDMLTGDYEEIDGEWYQKDEVQEIRDEIEDEEEIEDE